MPRGVSVAALGVKEGKVAVRGTRKTRLTCRQIKGEVTPLYRLPRLQVVGCEVSIADMRSFEDLGNDSDRN